MNLPKNLPIESTLVNQSDVNTHDEPTQRLRVPMQALLDALNEFEPGFVMERCQPTLPEAADPPLSMTKP